MFTPELYKLVCELQASGEFTISRGKSIGMDKEAIDLLLKAQRLIDDARCKVYETINKNPEKGRGSLWQEKKQSK